MYDELYYGSWLARYFCDAVCPGRNCLGACVCYATARYRMTAKHSRWCEIFERWLRKQPAVRGVAFLAGGARFFAGCLPRFFCFLHHASARVFGAFVHVGCAGVASARASSSRALRKCEDARGRIGQPELPERL